MHAQTTVSAPRKEENMRGPIICVARLAKPLRNTKRKIMRNLNGNGRWIGCVASIDVLVLTFVTLILILLQSTTTSDYIRQHATNSGTYFAPEFGLKRTYSRSCFSGRATVYHRDHSHNTSSANQPRYGMVARQTRTILSNRFWQEKPSLHLLA